MGRLTRDRKLSEEEAARYARIRHDADTWVSVRAMCAALERQLPQAIEHARERGMLELGMVKGGEPKMLHTKIKVEFGVEHEGYEVVGTAEIAEHGQLVVTGAYLVKRPRTA